MSGEEIKQAEETYLRGLDLYLLGEVECILEGINRVQG